MLPAVPVVPVGIQVHPGRIEIVQVRVLPVTQASMPVPLAATALTHAVEIKQRIMIVGRGALSAGGPCRPMQVLFHSPTNAPSVRDFPPPVTNGAVTVVTGTPSQFYQDVHMHGIMSDAEVLELQPKANDLKSHVESSECLGEIAKVSVVCSCQ